MSETLVRVDEGRRESETEGLPYQKLGWLKERVLLILNKSKLLSSTKIHHLMLDCYKHRTVPCPVTFNYLCIQLRYLYRLGLVGRKDGNGTYGRATYYFISEECKRQLNHALPSYDDNSL